MAGILAAACSGRWVTGEGGGEGAESSSGGSSGTASTAGPSSTTTSTTAGSTAPEPSSTGASDESSDEGFPFIEAPDHPSGWCNVERQEGCARGEKCTLFDQDGSGQWDAAVCRPLDPNGRDLYETCAYEDGPYQGAENCDAQSLCMYMGGDEPQCVGLCLFVEPGSYDATCEDPLALPEVGCHECFCLCVPQCNPLAQDCGDGWACYPDNDGFQCVPDASGDEGAIGTPCEFINVCDPGLFCAGAEGVPGCEATGCCTTYCDLEVGACYEGTECVAWYERGQAPPGMESVGACVINP